MSQFLDLSVAHVCIIIHTTHNSEMLHVCEDCIKCISTKDEYYKALKSTL